MTGFNTFPGRFTVTLEDGLSFTSTHTPDNARQTLRPETGTDIWILGCSYTYGWSLNDEETFSYKLQAAMPDARISNYGKPGFSTLQNLLLFEQLLECDTPDVVVLVHASFHGERNIGSYSWVRTLSEYNRLGTLRQPILTVAADSFKISSVDISNFSPRLAKYSAIAHFAKTNQGRRKNMTYANKSVLYVLDQLTRRCIQLDIKLLVAGITMDDETRELLKYCKKSEISGIDISVDLSISENTNLPFDSHPSAVANDQYAGKILKLIELATN